MGSSGLKYGAALLIAAAAVLSSPSAKPKGAPFFAGSKPLAERLSSMHGRENCKTPDCKNDTLWCNGGAKRIAWETPDDAESLRRYCSLVDSIARILRDDFRIGPAEPQRFMREMLGMMYGNLRFTYGNEQVGYLGVSVRSGKWDCSNSAFLVADVARKLGIRAGFAVCVNHILAAVGGRYYETVEGDTASYSEKEVAGKHHVYFVTYDFEGMEYLSCLNRANHLILKDPNLALENVLAAIRMVPQKAEPYYFAGYIYSILGDSGNARAYAKKSVEIYGCPETFNGAGAVHYSLGEYRTAIAYFEKALEIADGRMRRIVCENLALAWLKEGDAGKARKCFEMVGECSP